MRLQLGQRWACWKMSMCRGYLRWSGMAWLRCLKALSLVAGRGSQPKACVILNTCLCCRAVLPCFGRDIVQGQKVLSVHQYFELILSQVTNVSTGKKFLPRQNSITQLAVLGPTPLKEA